MKGTQGKWVGWLGLLLALAVVPCVRAVLFESTGNPAFNTNAPTGSLTNSGWQYEGQWYSWLGTPIAPTFFLTAHHINGLVGGTNILNGVNYITVASYDDPDSDLRIWQVGQTFPYYAPLYTNSDEEGNTCVIIGRGTQRGSAVVVNTTTNGWMWGTDDHVERWGENVVSGVATGVDTEDGSYPTEQLLTGYFQNNGNSNECAVSYDDSGGAMFIEEDGTWKLAGITCAVTGYTDVNTNGSGSGFSASLVDIRGLYFLDGEPPACSSTGCWTILYATNCCGGPVIAPEFESTRVSARISWINSILTAAPTAIFSGSPTNGAAPLTVTFTDSSTGPISNRFWSFGDGATTNFVNATNPTHTYTDGLYSVTLIVSGVGGSSTNTVANMIGVYDPFAWWQLYYFGSTNNNPNTAPGGDYTGTGMSNTNEFLAGFNPTNAAAYLHIISVAATNTTDMNVIYLGANGDTNYAPGVGSRTNILEYSTGAAGGSYNGTFLSVPSGGATNILSGGTGAGVVTNMVDPGGATNLPSRYYRVRVLLP